MTQIKNEFLIEKFKNKYSVESLLEEYKEQIESIYDTPVQLNYGYRECIQKHCFNFKVNGKFLFEVELTKKYSLEGYFHCARTEQGRYGKDFSSIKGLKRLIKTAIKENPYWYDTFNLLPLKSNHGTNT